MSTAAMKKYRGLLKATVYNESYNRRTSNEIARLFRTRHRKAIEAVAAELILAKIIKDVDGVSRLKPKRINPQQFELFEILQQFKVIEIVSFPTVKNGKARFEIRALDDLSLDELAALIARRQKRSAKKTDSVTANYIKLYDAVSPYGEGKTKTGTACLAWNKAQRRG